MFYLCIFLLLAVKRVAGQSNGLACYYCDHSETWLATANDKDITCMRNFTEAHDHQRLCVGIEICKAQVIWRNGAFSEVHRGCDPNCRPSCRSQFYGVTVLTCTRCCNTSLCNDGRDKAFFSGCSSVKVQSATNYLSLVFMFIYLTVKA